MSSPSGFTSANRGLTPGAYRSPRVSLRIVSTQIVTGFHSTNGWSHVGKVASGTNAVLTNTNGKTIVNRAACTASIVFSDRPANADTHVNAYPTATMPMNASRA